jgi:hypothetical protein
LIVPWLLAGVFVRVLRKRLRRRGPDLHFLEYDLISEMRVLTECPVGAPAPGPRASASSLRHSSIHRGAVHAGGVRARS